jgi:phosphate starvation-inducible PhoH-like protein
MSRKARKLKKRDTSSKRDHNLTIVPSDSTPLPQVKKTWTIHDIKTVSPLTPNQAEAFHEWFAGQNLFLHGTAGTGKSFVAIYLALNEVLSKINNIDQIRIVRSVVPTRDQGFLPGTEEEKQAVYETPYVDIFSELIGRPNTYRDMKKAGKVKFVTTSYIRGTSWNDSVVIVEEAQNMTEQEFDSVMTRIGKNSKIIITGDTKRQNDLIIKNGHSGSGIQRAERILNLMDEFTSISYNTQDIVRSGLVKSWIMASEEVS